MDQKGICLPLPITMPKPLKLLSGIAIRNLQPHDPTVLASTPPTLKSPERLKESMAAHKEEEAIHLLWRVSLKLDPPFLRIVNTRHEKSQT